MNKLIRHVMFFICKDVQNNNETKKTAIIIRMITATMYVHFLVLLGLFCIIRSLPGIIISLFCLLLYGICGCLTYHNKTNISLLIINLFTLFWIILLVVIFGWNIGVQHYLFACALIYLFTCYDNKIFKLWYIVLLCLIRFALYFYTNRYDPVFTINKSQEIVFQVINTISIFVSISEIAIVFNAKSLEMEKKLMQYNKKLEKQAATDPLTGLSNRRKVMTYLEEKALRYDVESKGFTIAICDIDDFKSINDNYGHDCGDYVLKEISQIMKTFMEKKGHASRWGGEEFLLTFNDCNMDEAYGHLYNLMLIIRHKNFIYYDTMFKVTLTFGLEEFGKETGIQETIKVADGKLYHGKRMGKNRIVY